MVHLEIAFSLNVVTNGVASGRDGRIFMTIARFDGSDGARVAERINGELKPYPDAVWNSWTFGDIGRNRLVRVNSVRFGPDDDLWLVDVGAPGMGRPRIRDGPKLVCINVAANQVRRVYPMDDFTTDRSFIDDVRFNGNHAYITDAGDPAIIVLDLQTGSGRRVLEQDRSTTAQQPISAEGKVILGSDGKPVFVHADQLEVSPDGQWLYFQPCSGPLYRLATSLLDNPTKTDQLPQGVSLFASTTTTGGTAIDAEGNIYASDADRQRILRITPEGKIDVMLEDPRLLWIDAMWIDHGGYLWMPSAQLNRLGTFQGAGGISRIVYPIQVYKAQIGVGPSALDHW